MNTFSTFTFNYLFIGSRPNKTYTALLIFVLPLVFISKQMTSWGGVY